MAKLEVGVIGAGIIGSTIALSLQREGHRVTLYDYAQAGRGASFGNAGVVVNGSCVPTAMPGSVLSGLRMLGDRMAPLHVRPAYFPKALPWLVRFIHQSTNQNVAHNGRALYALSQSAVMDWLKLASGTPIADLLHDCGWLKVYSSDSSFAATQASRSLMDEVGSPYEILNQHELRDLEPYLSRQFKKGIFQRDSLRVSNPHALVTRIVEQFRAAGGNMQRSRVERVIASRERASLSCGSSLVPFDRIVIAAGAHSRRFCDQLGDKVPLDTERGYHLMLRNSINLLQRPVMHGEHQFVLAPMDSGIRLTGGVEFAGTSAAPDYRYIRRMLPLAKNMLPALDATEDTVWMGCRPSLPDSLPVLGPATKAPAFIYAFGHQHLGMTLAATTARIIADLVAGREAPIEMHAYRACRFGRPL